MNIHTLLRIARVATTCTVLFISSDASAQTKSSPKTNVVISEVTSLATTFCIGRYALDFPVGSRISGGNYIYKFTRLEKPEQISLQSFEAAIAEKEKALKAMKHEIEPSLLRLSLRPDTHSHILVFWEEDFTEAIAEVEGYRWIDGIRFVIKGRAGMSKPSHGTISRQDIVINRMREILAHLRPRSDGEIPSEPGYCFEGGFISSPKWGNEEAGIDIDIAGHPDAFISVWFYPLAMSKHDRPLLERMSGVLQSLGRLATSVRVLRSGDRQVGPYRGQEHLATAPNSGGMRGHSFIWETEGQGTFETPALKIELTTGHRDKDGNPQKTKLTDEQAMKLWDEVLNSFRVRPTASPEKLLHRDPAAGMPQPAKTPQSGAAHPAESAS